MPFDTEKARAEVRGHIQSITDQFPGFRAVSGDLERLVMAAVDTAQRCEVSRALRVMAMMNKFEGLVMATQFGMRLSLPERTRLSRILDRLRHDTVPSLVADALNAHCECRSRIPFLTREEEEDILEAEEKEWGLLERGRHAK